MNAFTARIGDTLRGLVALARREPGRTLAIARTLGLLVLSVWPNLLTADQQTLVWGLIVLFIGGDEVVRHNSTSTIKPVLPIGKAVTSPAGTPARVVATE